MAEARANPKLDRRSRFDDEAEEIRRKIDWIRNGTEKYPSLSEIVVRMHEEEDE